MSTCLTCRNWDARNLPTFAQGMGLAFCQIKNTRAVTLAHWRACSSWASAPADDVTQRVQWLARRGVVVNTERSGAERPTGAPCCATETKTERT